MQEIGFCTLEEQCPYLKEKRTRIEYKYLQNCSKKLNNELIKRGWRRFGRYFSRPICAQCKECLSLRILAQEYQFSRSERRIFHKNTNTKILLRRPNLSDEHLYLYDKYHRFMEEKRAWKRYDLNFRQYYNLYIDGEMDFGYELAFYKDDKLICVDLIDILEDGISSIYCFYDPDFSYLSLGKFSLLNEIKIAQNKNLAYVYLGYFVKKCQSLSYKADYTPNEILKSASLLCEDLPLWEKMKCK
ncbi:arginyltransferase [Campylobacter sp. MIT 21-1685]|uniref:arginyltransferase n=1 Tax=unclassified Campylobacter TaxID=2593542 RepID=UPI00224ACAE5|nr:MULTISPECIES: arginyltransferase [unclassified Campylobacter]MCX2682323.1 arginyltransferase [Campylobacter sp. MIT 21-1684]MCX2750603.1 arginyltransferase [Campylobacter sp. MIT 21-1682]MCX2806850.1 arginyltransferase [Campylobacter sp. MIT 21-1685]